MHQLRRLAPAIVLAVTMVAACSSDRSAGPPEVSLQPERPIAMALGDPVIANQDTYVASADNTSRGTRDSLVVDGTGSNRVLVRMLQSDIAASVGSGTVTSAKLELTIKATNTGWPSGGATVSLHRVLKNWTEAGATWNCAIDSNTGNSSADCSGQTAWSMTSGAGTAWDATAIAQATITNGKTGVVSLDVTADVVAFLNGSKTNYGWLLKRTTEGSSGRVSFRARQHTSPPRLVLTVTSNPKLLTIKGEGVTGSPAGGTTTHTRGSQVTYSFGLQSGYDSLLVLVDDVPVAASGTVVMDTSHVLLVAAHRVVTPLAGTATLVTEAHALLTAPDKPAQFQAFIDHVMTYAATTDNATAADALLRVQALAFNPTTDSAALRNLYGALGNHQYHIAGPDPLAPLPDGIESVGYLYVNGINTLETDLAGPIAILRALIKALPTYDTSYDYVGFQYNRTHLAQIAIAPTSTEYKLLRCQQIATERSYAQPDTWYLGQFWRCLATIGVSSADLVEAFRQLYDLYWNSPLLEEDADSVAEHIQAFRHAGRHVIAIGHSQGNMMIQQGIRAMELAGQYKIHSDSLGIAALALAAPSSANWPLDAYHMSVINVQGDFVAALSGYPVFNTPLSDAAVADVVSIEDPDDRRWAAWQWGTKKLHWLYTGYLGQQVIYTAIGDSLTKLKKELVIGQVESSLQSVYLEVEGVQSLDSTVVAVKNKNGRRLEGRRLRYIVGNPSVASVDASGVLHGLAVGTTYVIVKGRAAPADTVQVTVADRPADWGPPLTAHDSLTTGTWQVQWIGRSRYPGDVADVGSGTYTLALEAHDDVVRGTVSWTSAAGSFTRRVTSGNNQVVYGVPPQPDAYKARIRFYPADYGSQCQGAPNTVLDLVYQSVPTPQSTRTATGYSYISCNGGQMQPSDHARDFTSAVKTSGPLSSLRAP